MLSHLAQAFVLGLSMGPACLGYCAPVCVPLLGSGEQSNWRATARHLGIFLLGRLAGYTVIGGIAGLAGAFLFREARGTLWGSMHLAMGMMLVLFGALNGTAKSRQCAMPSPRENPPWFGASLGLLTGLNLCPPFGAAIAGAAATASVQNSLSYFWAFFAGTAVYFLPLIFISPFTRMEPVRQVARICMVLVGIWMIAQGGMTFLAMVWIHQP